MKIRRNNLIVILVSLIVICINSISLSKYDDTINCTFDTQIAKGIINLEKDEIIDMKINQNSFPVEYNFSINNYDDKNINEVDFNYCIELENSIDNFPVSYVVFDCNNNEEIKFVDGKSEQMRITKNIKETRNFKIYFQWREIDGELADDVHIKLKINIVQSKEEKI